MLSILQLALWELGRSVGDMRVYDLREGDELVKPVEANLDRRSSLLCSLSRVPGRYRLVPAHDFAGGAGRSEGDRRSRNRQAYHFTPQAEKRLIFERQIRVNVVAPGAINTPLLQQTIIDNNRTELRSSNPMGRRGDAKEVAVLLGWLLGPESTFVTGALYQVDGGHHCQMLSQRKVRMTRTKMTNRITT